MEITKQTIQRVAEVSRLKLSESELKEFVAEFKEILDVFSKIDEVNTNDVEPSFQPVGLKNVLREDEAEKCLTQERALSQTRHKQDGYFKGPRVI
ncbi:MAG TPA: Asp-tRNA(Asn)/Glu-tRNA(Gln) amidotransferase subunit GatC [Candidatus Nanoarchaeia archaeon]|nr:Asp-tRNA(Asn)/Glu-tRNA(Gln) amidotransferase subunit GatC [Candidatus Nanoarchaeia archaeon]